MGITEKLTTFFWLTLPWRMRRLSTGAVYALVDGAYVVSWPRIAAWGSVAAMGAGLFIGWWHPGFETVFSESLTIMIIAAVMGILGAHFGLLFVAGFAVGDFLLGGLDKYSLFGVGGINWIIRLFAPQFLEYALLALLVVSTPLLVKHLLASLPYPAKWSRPAMLTAAFIGHLVLTVVAVYIWAQLVPVLIRPLFTWRGVLPTTEMAIVLQENLAPLLWAVTVASLVRMFGQAVLATRPRQAARLNVWQQKLLSVAPVGTWLTEKTPNWLVSVGKIAGTTFLLSGVFIGWGEAGAIAVVLAVVYAAQDGLIPVPLGSWRQLAYRIPLVGRVVIGVVVVYGLSAFLLGIQGAPSQGFRPTVVVMGISFLVLYFLNPGQEVRLARKERHV